MNTNDIIKFDKNYIANTYGRYELVPQYGTNATVYDIDNKEYIDFSAGIGVNSLGISDPEWVGAVTEQLSKIQHISNYYYSEQSAKLAKTLVEKSSMKKVLFSNSGAEANEAVIKLARKYSYDKYGKDRYKIITLKNSFHGRTITTLAATGQDVFHDFFFPFTEGFVHSALNNKDELSKNIDQSVCAIICEPIQGEGGVNSMEDSFAEYLYEICQEKDILLIFDEVQTGIGRTGKFFASQHFKVKPDAITLAKGLGGGLPVGCVIIGEKCENVFSPGQHGSTFASNPVVCAGANVVMKRLSENDFLNEVTKKGAYISDKITSWKLPCIKQIKGKGLMLGIQTTLDNKLAAKRCLENGLMILTAGADVLRMLPPLTITYEEIDKGLKRLKHTLES